MYRTLQKLKDRIGREAWMKMVHQAKEKGKLTEEEYEDLTKGEE